MNREEVIARMYEPYEKWKDGKYTLYDAVHILVLSGSKPRYVHEPQSYVSVECMRIFLSSPTWQIARARGLQFFQRGNCWNKVKRKILLWRQSIDYFNA